LSYNLLGYLPGPFIYGTICEYTGGKDSRWGIIFTMAMNIPIILFVGLSLFYKEDFRLYWAKRREEIIRKYIESNRLDDRVLSHINDQHHSVDETYSKF